MQEECMDGGIRKNEPIWVFSTLKVATKEQFRKFYIIWFISPVKLGQFCQGWFYMWSTKKLLKFSFCFLSPSLLHYRRLDSSDFVIQIFLWNRNLCTNTKLHHSHWQAFQICFPWECTEEKISIRRDEGFDACESMQGIGPYIANVDSQHKIPWLEPVMQLE